LDGVEPSNPPIQVAAPQAAGPQSISTPKVAEPPKSVETAQSKAVEPPVVPDHFLQRPAFQTTLGDTEAGTAFAVRLTEGQPPVLLTAVHLIGEAGGLPRNIPAKDAPTALKGVELKDCFDGSGPVAIGHDVIPIPEAGALGTPSKAGDILALWLPDSTPLHIGRLATSVPGRGERVWLAAQLLAGAPPTTRLHSAVSLGIDKEGDYRYRFDNPEMTIRATSGAPVLNAAGEVVAINLGGAKDDRGIIGIGNPVNRFRPFLEGAPKRPPNR
jgi:hypothetical protein